ncbi:MAG: hypothetical protein WC124_02250 [Desulfoplanes sp.]
MRTIETYTGKRYSAETVGQFDGHFWHAVGDNVHRLNIALGAAFGCDSPLVATMRPPIEYTRTRDGIYLGADGQLYAVNANEAFAL